MSDSSIVGLIWAVIVSVVVLLIVFGITSSKVKARRTRKQLQRFLPDVPDFIQLDRSYRVVLSSGLAFPSVRFQGLSSPLESGPQYPPFPLRQWLVLSKPDGKRIFVKPSAVRFYEEL